MAVFCCNLYTGDFRLEKKYLCRMPLLQTGPEVSTKLVGKVNDSKWIIAVTLYAIVCYIDTWAMNVAFKVNIHNKIQSLNHIIPKTML